MLDIRARAFLLALYLAWLGWAVPIHGLTRVTLRGTLFATQEDAGNGTFFLDPEDASETIAVTVNAGSYLAAYLDGSVGHRVVITIEPVPR